MNTTSTFTLAANGPSLIADAIVLEAIGFHRSRRKSDLADPFALEDISLAVHLREIYDSITPKQLIEIAVNLRNQAYVSGTLPEMEEISHREAIQAYRRYSLHQEATSNDARWELVAETEQTTATVLLAGACLRAVIHLDGTYSFFLQRVRDEMLFNWLSLQTHLLENTIKPELLEVAMLTLCLEAR